MKVKLSIVVLSYNTKDLLEDCLNSLEKVKNEVSFEIIVPDNGSNDGSVRMVKQKFPNVILIENKSNLGFAAGSNKARKYCKGKYVLFLNSDTLVKKNTLIKCIELLDKEKSVGAMTCKVLLPNGELDKDTRRSFITPWIGFTHIFLRIDRIFPKSKLFGKYWYGYMSEDKIHEVDALQGAFFVVRKKVLDKVGWLDEDYFLDGEDIDLSWKIRQEGWNILYYPKVSIIHIKGATKGKNMGTKKEVNLKEKMKFRMSGVNSMEIFYRKRLWVKYPLLLNYFVLVGIKFVKLIRFIKLVAMG